MLRLLLAVAAAAALLAPAAAGAQAPTGPRSETASSGSVAATLSYDVGEFNQASAVRLAVTRDGAPASLDGDLSRLCRGCRGAIPVGGLEGSGQPSIAFADLTGDGEPEILVDLYTGGAHCCSVMALFGWDAAATRYRRLARNWGDPSYAVRPAPDGIGSVLASADDRFAYSFCAYACSAMPIQVFRYRDFRLLDVTRQVPAWVRGDLRSLRGALRSARRHRDQGWAIKGILPAVCADLYLLGRGAACRAELASARRRGELGRQPPDDVPSGRAYVRAVLAFLDRAGYR